MPKINLKKEFGTLFLIILSTVIFSFSGCSKKQSDAVDSEPISSSSSETATQPATEKIMSEMATQPANEEKKSDIVEIQGEQAFIDLVDHTPIVIIDFNADWCGPCQKLLPVLEEIATQYKDQGLKVGSVNVDTNNFASHFKVQGIPDIRIFVNGQIVQKIVGYDPSKLKTGVQNALKMLEAQQALSEQMQIQNGEVVETSQSTEDLTVTEMNQTDNLDENVDEATIPLENELWPDDNAE
ncbi:MAG: thioredoxin family protein [Planctomycetia bacterium]|nr:thioredoxin family protein [Planctomycetia bacterium]